MLLRTQHLHTENLHVPFKRLQCVVAKTEKKEEKNRNTKVYDRKLCISYILLVSYTLHVESIFGITEGLYVYIVILPV